MYAFAGGLIGSCFGILLNKISKDRLVIVYTTYLGTAFAIIG
jgi:hypothetical protein